MLYSLALLGEHGHPLTALLARQLSEPALLRHPHLPRQYEHLAACLLASQADQAESPLLAALPPDVRGAAIEAWRARVRKQGAGKPNSYQKDVVDVLRGMELKGRANGVTADACVCADVILALPSDSNRYAIELTGAHNTAGNDPSRVLGEAALKLRLLRARGYMVIPVSCAEWARLGRGDLYAKILYIDARFKQRTGRTTSRSGSAGAAAADPGGSGSDDEGAQPPPGGAGGGPAGITRAAPSILPTPRL